MVSSQLPAGRGEPVFLPFHCPTLNCNYLRPPCAGQIAAAKERQRKFPHAVMPYGLDQCLRCKGEALVKQGEATMEYTGDIRPQTTKEIATIRENRIVQAEEPKVAGIVSSKSQEEAERVLGPGKIPAAEPGPPRCPKHPIEPQIACNPAGKRAGQYLGKCRICQQELVEKMNAARAKKRLKDEKMSPAVARDLKRVSGARGQVSGGEGVMEMRPLSPEQISKGQEAVGRLVDSYKLGRAAARPTCKIHLDRPVKFDSLGRSMGLCQECVTNRGRESGRMSNKQGATAPPFYIPLNQAKYADLKAWLIAQADEMEQKLEKQIMYRLKLAMRGAMDDG